MVGEFYTDKQLKKLENKTYIKEAMGHSAPVFGKSFIGVFMKRYPHLTHLLDYMCEALNMNTIQWKDLTKVHLRMVSDYLNGHLAPNSANTYCHYLMSLLNEYSDEGVLPSRGVAKAMRTKVVPSQHIALTLDEMDRFEAYEPQDDMERDVKNLFLRACYTGARSSDVKLMSMDNVSGGYLSYVSKKTKVAVTLPVHKNLPKYLEQEVSHEYTRMQVNLTIHRICEAIGMTGEVSLYVGGKRVTKPKYELVSMHTARRSFCTVMASIGVPVEQIRAMAGHTTTAMTDRYIVMDGRNPGADAMRFFNGEAKIKTA